MQRDSLDRRGFLAASGAAVAGLALSPEAQAARTEGQKTVRCGFVGVGNRGTRLLQSTIQTEGVEVAAVCDVDPAARARACEIVENVRARRPDETDDWNELLRRDDLTAVVSALPCDIHYPMYRDALAAGKHLYGEKPMCLTVSHANALVRHAESAGTVFQIGFQRRFSKALQASIEAFQQGIVGKPFEGRGVRFGSGGPFRQPGEWFSFRERSGDWMLEQAVHHWDTLNLALGELPVSAYGAGHQDLFKDWDLKRDVSDYYTATIRYRDGLIFTWTHTWASPRDSHFTGQHEQLVGPKGAIELGSGLVAFRPGASPDGPRTRQLVESRDRQNTTLLAVQGFFDCVRTGKPPVVGVKDGRDSTLFGLLVRKAVYERREVTMQEVLRETS